MKINIFTAADYVDASNGKLIIVGAFDNIETEKCPFLFKPFGIAIKIVREIQDRGKIYKGKILLRKINTHKAIFEFPVEVKFPSEKLLKIMSINIAANIGGIKFESYGPYRLVLILNNKIVDFIRLRVVQKISSNKILKK
ncbi:MAG: hypothetical protein EHM20_04305 [Alphaproteobacteria bacterium]|nr:MAG: hypothetical protein EHM20_04305 [Alphaproteobacteria bacterium]